MFILLILLSALEKEKKYILLMISEILFIIYIALEIKFNYGYHLFEYTLIFYLMYFIALARIGGKNNEDKLN